MIGRGLDFWKNLGSRVKQHIKQWTKPVTTTLVTETLSDMTRSRADLIAENTMLRQQLIVLNRQIKRPQLTNGDRIRLVLLARCTQFWQQALHIVHPDTLHRWHRDLFGRHWWRKSQKKKRKPRIAQGTIDLIRQMAKENRLWGAERIRGELLFVFIELHTRRIVHAAVTRSPSDAWAVQQLQEATPWGKGPKYLICDRDSKYGRRFSIFAASSGIKELKTPFQAPKVNAHCERCIGTLKRECLDHMLILHHNQLHRLVAKFVGYYNYSRPHQGIGQRIPARFDEEQQPQSGRITSIPVLSGLHHSYTPVAI
jgi:putative transposase